MCTFKNLAIIGMLCLSGCNSSSDTQDATKPTEAARYEGMSVKELGVDPTSFIEGNLYFLAYHEVGHALISEFDIPVVGREEDAVDQLATWIMAPADKDEPADYLIGAIKGWFTFADATPLSAIQWWDEHGTDRQRGYQIACLLYGSNPERFKATADAIDLPDQRRETCEADSSLNQSAWARLLADHAHPVGEDGAKENVSVRYEPTNDYADDQRYLKELHLLEDVAELMATGYKLQPGIVVKAEECGVANSFWQSDNRTIIICYELVDEYRRLAET